MTFTVAGDKYDRYMGRYVVSLAPGFVDAAGIAPGMRVLDVGCGPGGVTKELVSRTGADNVAGIDPSPPFVEACRERNPGADVREGAAEALPWEDDSFDAALASLVIGFMRDPQLGVLEMARVTKPGGTVAACFWDTARRDGHAAALLAGRVAHRSHGEGRAAADRRARGRAARPPHPRRPDRREGRHAHRHRPLRGLRRLLGAGPARRRARGRACPVPGRRRTSERCATSSASSWTTRRARST